MSRLYLYDDARARRFEPFASTRPISELRAGVGLVRERWIAALAPGDGGVFFLAGAQHRDFDEPGAARAAEGTIPAGSVVVDARCIPALPSDPQRIAHRTATCTMWRCGDRLAGVRLRAPMDADAFADGSLTLDQIAAHTGALATIDGWWLDDVWDLVRLLPEWLVRDIDAWAATPGVETSAIPTHVTVLGPQRVVLDQGVVIEPHVVLDTTTGPILIRSGTHIRAFTRVTGPCYIGRDVQVMGGDITASAIGDACKVRGELSTTTMVSHANKGHDGFVGHSYLGRWVNLGAGTITSNLKNTYGPVALWTPGGLRDTGMQFLGTLFGDHVKTGIGLRLTTGTVLGAGANVYGGMPPKAVAPFSWGEGAPYDVYQIGKFVEAAARMMARRHVELTDRARRHLAAAHAAHAGRWAMEQDVR